MFMTAFFKVSGMVNFLLVFTILFIVPVLAFFIPLARYLTLKQLFQFILQNPSLLIIHMITDFAFGPVEGYGKSKFRGCRYLNQCCLCIFCCEKCRFTEGGNVTFSKGLSWIKMAYSVTLTLLFYVIVIIEIKSYESNDILLKSYLIMLPIGIAGFSVTLHFGDKYGVIDMRNEMPSDLEENKCPSIT